MCAVVPESQHPHHRNVLQVAHTNQRYYLSYSVNIETTPSTKSNAMSQLQQQTFFNHTFTFND